MEAETRTHRRTFVYRYYGIDGRATYSYAKTRQGTLKTLTFAYQRSARWERYCIECGKVIPFDEPRYTDTGSLYGELHPDCGVSRAIPA